MHRLVFGLALALAILPLAAAPSATPSHPLSHIHPVDVDLNMSSQAIYNVSSINVTDGLRITDDAIQGGTHADLDYDSLRWNDSARTWEVRDSNLSLENNELQEFFAGKCDGGEAVAQVYSNGSYNCLSFTDATDDKYVNEAGDTVNGSLNFTDYADYSINNVSNISNFFAESCDGDDVITGIYEDGSYNCTSTSSLNPIEDLEETLNEGNFAGENNINMSGQDIISIRNLTYSDSGSEGVNSFKPQTSGDDDDLIFATGDGGSTNYDRLTIEGGSIQSNVTVSSANLELNDNNITGLGSIEEYFQTSCSGDLVVDGINANGTYDCVNPAEATEIENLSETLTAGNVANQSINLSGNDLTWVDNITTGGSPVKIWNTDFDEPALTVNEFSDVNVSNGNLDIGGGNLRMRDTNGDDSENIEFFQNSYSNIILDEQDGRFRIYNKSNGNNLLRADTQNGNIEIPSGNLNLSNNNLTDYWNSNVCGENKAVQKIYENGTVVCTPEIEFSVEVENLSETLSAGSVANQTIYMDGSNISGPGYVDGVDLDNPGNAINLTGNKLGVDTDSLDDSEVADDSLTNNSIDSFSSFTLQDLKITNNLTGSNVINSNQINSGAVIKSKINNGAVGNNKIALSSVNTTQIQDDNVTGSEIASNSITRTGGELDSSVAGDALTYESGSLNVSKDETLTISSNDLGIADSGVDTLQIAESAVTNGEIAIDAVNRSQISQTGCTDNDVLEWTGSEWSCSTVEDLGTDDQNLTVFNNTNGQDDTIQIENGNNITVDDNVTDGDNSDTNELQNLSEVLVQGNTSNQSIDMDNNSLNDVYSVDGGSDALRVESNLDTKGNSVTSSGGEMCIGDQCP